MKAQYHTQQPTLDLASVERYHTVVLIAVLLLLYIRIS